jgi:GST-like protein
MTAKNIDLYTWSTPNGRKVSIMLEEVGMAYQVCPIDITNGDQHKPEFLMISPNNKIPAIVDHNNGIQLMESGAILMYLAHKSGKLISPMGPKYWQEIEWLMLQMGGVGPMLGQAHHFLKFNSGKSSYAEERYSAETHRLYGVLNERLKISRYLGEDYSIADIATWPWISRYEWQEMELNDFPYLKNWYLRIADRSAVQRGYAVPKNLEIPRPD